MNGDTFLCPKGEADWWNLKRKFQEINKKHAFDSFAV